MVRETRRAVAGERGCALRPRETTPDETECAQQGLERVRDPKFDPDEGYEWPTEDQDGSGQHGE